MAEKRVKKALQPRESGAGGDLFTLIFGTILGGIAGVITAFWFAPRSGKETRQKVVSEAEEVRRRIEGDSISDSLEVGKAEARRLNQLS